MSHLKTIIFLSLAFLLFISGNENISKQYKLEVPVVEWLNVSLDSKSEKSPELPSILFDQFTAVYIPAFHFRITETDISRRIVDNYSFHSERWLFHIKPTIYKFTHPLFDRTTADIHHYSFLG